MNKHIAENKTKVQLNNFQRQLSQNIKRFKSLLPSHITPEKFLRTIVTAVQANPKLLDCTHESLIQAAMRCAKDGLLPDGREAVFIQFWSKNGYTAQYIPMYMGLLKRVRNSGLIFSIDAQVVYENDYFKWIQGTKPDIEHEPLFIGDRGEPTGAYAIAFYKGTTEKQFVVLRKPEIDKIMESRKDNKGNIPKVWMEHYEAMAQKTALRRLVKFLPMDADIFDSSPDTELENEELIHHDPVIMTDDFTPSNPNDDAPQLETPPPSKLDDFNQNIHLARGPEHIEVPHNLFNDINASTL
ncbi:hypothetical protein COMNV_01183 [Commensalibacter sp. Nvir]|uniref:recombinase RecT n=1 Tax=Commensalibacter sp. Nvir TaxID=3069817 RepID=UPI002D479537|nr:hypothetical protein COMNV_01183 [Commensalibacter sp. Nvir]